MNLPNPEKKLDRKWTLATLQLAGCFGCHTSFLDIDERILELVKFVDLQNGPFTDFKEYPDDSSPLIDFGLVEGGCSDTGAIKALKKLRKHCRILISIGQCAINGNLPAMRNGKTVEEILRESYVDGLTVANPLIPDDEELPKLLDRVYPCHEIVKIDGFLPGCPPKADLFWDALHLLMSGKSLHEISFRNVRYD